MIYNMRNVTKLKNEIKYNRKRDYQNIYKQ